MEEPMSTQKQIEANSQNAKLSTGPMTYEGKAVVATNAIKHGIFTKTLIVTSKIGQENEAEYQLLLNNLIDCLLPCNQMESLLVEKIAVDFWRLRRIIRFETGSIANHIATLVKEFYSYEGTNNDAIEKDIILNRQTIEWNTRYIEYLTQGKVTFDVPIWSEGAFESDIIEDFYWIAKSISNLAEKDSKLVYGSVYLDFNELRAILEKHGYNDSKSISVTLIEIYKRENLRLKKNNEKLLQQKLSYDARDKLTYMLGMAPAAENTDKILKYERSLQKSIFQNLLMLKKLQGIF